MHIGRPYILNTPSFLILFRSALFKAAASQLKEILALLMASLVPLSLLSPWNQDLHGCSRKLGASLTTHNMNCIRSKIGKEKDGAFQALLTSFLGFYPLNLQSIYLYKFPGLYCCLLFSFTITMRSHFDLMEALVSLLLGVGMTTALLGNQKWSQDANSTDFQMEMALWHSRIRHTACSSWAGSGFADKQLLMLNRDRPQKASISPLTRGCYHWDSTAAIRCQQDFQSENKMRK